MGGQLGQRPSPWHTPRLSQLRLLFSPLDPFSELLDGELFPNFGVGLDADLEAIVSDSTSNPIEIERSLVRLVVFFVVHVVITHLHPFLGFSLTNLISIAMLNKGSLYHDYCRSLHQKCPLVQSLLLVVHRC